MPFQYLVRIDGCIFKSQQFWTSRRICVKQPHQYAEQGLCNSRVSVRLSVCLSQHGSRYRSIAARRTAARRTAGECGQCHVVSVRSSWTQTCMLFSSTRNVTTALWTVASYEFTRKYRKESQTLTFKKQGSHKPQTPPPVLPPGELPAA